MKPVWRPGNRVDLLENGAAFFPRVFAAIRAAREEVLIETFILFDDKVGQELRATLIEAARRGVTIDLMVDGYGSPDLSEDFIGGMTAVGIRFRIFGPGPTWYGVRTNVFRRMHRKLVVVDARIAFVGGINFSADHLDDFGPTAKQDYAVEVEGPVVDDIRAFITGERVPRRRWYQWPLQRRPHATAAPVRAGNADVLFVTRDNQHHRNDIERHYRIGVRTARRELVIANAYFFPGYRLLRDIRNAARRGVRVTLILQGQPDVQLAMAAARWLYRYLVNGGVQIYEYCRRPLHGKVAFADEEWVTVGSSNLDPLSLSLNLEANVVIRDRALAAELRQRLFAIVDEHCRKVDPDALPPRSFWQSAWGTFIFHVLRRFPAWAGMLPAHTPEVAVVRPAVTDGAPQTLTEASAEAANAPQFEPPAQPDRVARP